MKYNYSYLIELNKTWLDLIGTLDDREVRAGLLFFQNKQFKVYEEHKRSLMVKVDSENVFLAKNPDREGEGWTCSCKRPHSVEKNMCGHALCALIYWYEVSEMNIARLQYLSEIITNETQPYALLQGDFNSNRIDKIRSELDKTTLLLDGPAFVYPSANHKKFTVLITLSPKEVFDVIVSCDTTSICFTCNCGCSVPNRSCIHIIKVIEYLYNNRHVYDEITGYNLDVFVNADEVSSEPPGHIPQRLTDIKILQDNAADSTVVERIPIFNAKVTEQIEVNHIGQWLEVTGFISWGQQLKVHFIDIIKAIQKGERHILLPNGAMGEIPESLVKRVNALLTTAVVSKKSVKVRDINASEVEAFAIKDNPFLQTLSKQIKSLNPSSIHESTQDLEQPIMLQANLRPYQLEGYRHFVYYSRHGWGFCLNDDMGLGKTIQTIAFLCHLKSENKSIRSLIISPVSVIQNWGAELDKFAPKLSYVVYHGKDRKHLLSNSADVVITSYSIVNNDIELLKRIEWDVIVIDEAHHIRNIKSLKTQRVLELSGKNRFALTGTLVQNTIKDLYPIFDFLNPGIFGSIHKFKADTSGIDKKLDRKQLRLISKKVSHFTLRRRKDQVAKDLPEKIEEVVYVTMSDDEHENYSYLMNIYRSVVAGELTAGGGRKFHMTLLPIINKLRFMCDSSALLNKDKEFHENLVLTRESSKIEVLMDRVNEILSNDEPNSKILIFSMFTSVLDVLESFLKENKRAFYRIDGSVDNKKRKSIQDAINNPGDPVPVCLISITAGGEGMNLQGANYIFNLDPHWNPAIEQQAFGRAHRIGQKQTVFVYRLVCANTIEERILDIQERKKVIARAIEDKEFVFDEIVGVEPTEEEVRYLFDLN